MSHETEMPTNELPHTSVAGDPDNVIDGPELARFRDDLLRYSPHRGELFVVRYPVYRGYDNAWACRTLDFRHLLDLVPRTYELYQGQWHKPASDEKKARGQ